MDKRKGKILEAVLEKEEVGPSKVGYNKSSEESEVEATLLKMLHQEQRKWKMWKTIKEFPQKEAHQQTKRVSIRMLVYPNLVHVNSTKKFNLLVGMELDTNEDMAIQKELERIRIRIQTMITTHPHLNRRERFPKKGGMRVKT